jgi:hypothetical protein
MLRIVALLMVTTGMLPVCASADTTQTNTQAQVQAQEMVAAELRTRAERDDAEAGYKLRVTCANGQGVPQDCVQAHKRESLAVSRASGDNQRAFTKGRDALFVRMTPAQADEAQQ